MKIIFIIFSLTFLFSCTSDKKETKTTPSNGSKLKMFTQLSPEESGINFSNVVKEDIHSTQNIFFYEYLYSGGGVAIGDVNNDGLSDVFLVSNSMPNKLYINKGNMQFEDVTKGSGLDKNKRWSTGAVMVDINNDNLLDIYVCQGGPYHKNKEKKRNALYINQGNGKFSEEARKYGLDDSNISTHSSFFDYDKDGDLDCFVINESILFRVDYKMIAEKLIPFKEKLPPHSSKLYENVDGKFVDKTNEGNVLDFAYALGIVTADINNDGWVDIYVSNDYSIPDFLYINQKDGTFKESIKEYTKHTSWFAMGVDFNDFNNDGLGDLAVVDMASADHFRSKVFMASMNVDAFNYNKDVLKRHPGFMFNTLQINNGNNTFSNIADFSGTSKTEWSWASLLADFDNDGKKDYFVTTGNRKNYQHNDVRIEMRKLKKTLKNPVGHPELVKLYKNLSVSRVPNMLFKNTGDLKFKEVSEEWGVDQKSFSNGAAYADLDNDGDLDLIVNNIDEKIFVLRNNSEKINKNNYLKFKFPKNATGYNGKIKLYLDNGEILFQEYAPTRGYLSSVEHTLHFGAGKLKTIPKVEIIWPNGKVEHMHDVATNQVINLEIKNANASAIVNTKKAVLKEVNPTDLGLEYTHLENNFDDYTKQILLPYKHSTPGPCVKKGDLNGDGLEDVFVGGPTGQKSEIWFQRNDGTFTQKTIPVFENDKIQEAVNAHIFDFDGDKDLDILVLNGGYEFDEGSVLLKDVLYINNGKGHFKKASENIFPDVIGNSSVATSGDVDADGDLDLFIGGRVVSGKYPKSESSVFFRNENGKFKIDNNFLGQESFGIVRDAHWADINNDNKPDLVTAGEWEDVQIRINKGTNLELDKDLFEKYHSGWWSSLNIMDIDGDGDLDLLVGNVGENTKFQTSKEKKLSVFANDFDDNGTYDVVLSKTYKNKDVPVRGLQCLSDQVPVVKQKYNSYVDFANANLQEILGEEKTKKGLKRILNAVSSGVFVNKNGKYEFVKYPNLAQISPVLTTVLYDINKDGKKDIIIGGNIYDTEVETPSWDAGNGLVMINTSTKDHIELTPMSIQESGLFIPKNVRDMELVSNKDGGVSIIVLNNSDKLQVFKEN